MKRMNHFRILQIIPVIRILIINNYDYYYEYYIFLVWWNFKWLCHEWYVMTLSSRNRNLPWKWRIIMEAFCFQSYGSSRQRITVLYSRWARIFSTFYSTGMNKWKKSASLQILLLCKKYIHLGCQPGIVQMNSLRLYRTTSRRVKCFHRRYHHKNLMKITIIAITIMFHQYYYH